MCNHRVYARIVFIWGLHDCTLQRLVMFADFSGAAAAAAVLDDASGGDVDLSTMRLTDGSVAKRLARLPADATRALYLFSNQLQTVPAKQLARFQQLRLLWLGNNCIADASSLPPMPVLCTLDLTNNRLERLPASFFTNREALTSLWLSNNALTTLPREIGTLTSLRRLWLDHNRLCALPTPMARLQCLHSLSMLGNEELPPELQRCADDHAAAQQMLADVARLFARHDRCRTCALLLVHGLRREGAALPNEMLRRIGQAVWATRNEPCWVV